MTAPTPQEVMLLRSIKRTAVLLLLMIRLDRPATAKELADILDADYSTIRKHLRELSRLSLVTETRAGWMLTQGGGQLLLSPFNADSHIDTPLSPDNAEKPRFEARKNRDTSASASLNQNTFLLEEEEEEERTETRKNRADPEDMAERLAALEDAGVNGINGDYAQSIARLEWCTPDYINYQARRLHKERKFSSGMLLRVISDHDPGPSPNTDSWGLCKHCHTSPCTCT